MLHANYAHLHEDRSSELQLDPPRRLTRACHPIGPDNPRDRDPHCRRCSGPMLYPILRYLLPIIHLCSSCKFSKFHQVPDNFESSCSLIKENRCLDPRIRQINSSMHQLIELLIRNIRVIAFFGWVGTFGCLVKEKKEIWEKINSLKVSAIDNTLQIHNHNLARR